MSMGDMSEMCKEESVLEKLKIEEEDEEEEEEKDFTKSQYFKDLDEEVFVGTEGHKKKAEYLRYIQQLDDTEGFGVDFCIGPWVIGAIQPIDLSVEVHKLSEIEDCVKFAIKQYNDDKNANLKLEKILKVTGAFGFRFLYFITFEVSDASSSTQDRLIYQTKVSSELNNPIKDVKFFRRKPEAHNYSY